MESGKARLVVYLIVVLILSTFAGMTIMRFTRASQVPDDVKAQTRADVLRGLEKSPDLRTPAARNFIQNERQRQEDTKDIEKEVLR